MNKDNIIWERPNVVEHERQTARLKAFYEMARVLQSNQISQPAADLAGYREQDFLSVGAPAGEILFEE
jgi:hypothetical protein